MDESHVEAEVATLRTEITRLGTAKDDGTVEVTFGVLFDDERCVGCRGRVCRAALWSA